MINKKTEILAPAGAMEQLVAAVRAGADAVYIGSGTMNARQAASNFNGEQLDEAVAYCHERGVKVYLAMNTLLFDDEFDEAVKLLKHACSLPVDALIVQDIGLAAAARSIAPQMPLHASTQMTVHNPAALNVLEKMGFVRAILAREMSADEIEAMSKVSEMELEAFVHGALCMSVSGQCYLSAMLGSRSGNRGRCAQPCRLPFRADGFDNCLSLKDMSHIEHTAQLVRCGVSSLKIEGRLKRPEYCAAAVAACRSARDDGGVPPELMQSLEAVFSRSGFTDGYFTGKRGATMFGSRTKEDVTAASSAVFAALHNIYKNEFARVPLDIAFKATEGEPAVLKVTDDCGNALEVTGAVPLIAEKHPMTCEAVGERMAKTGGTPYIASNIICDIGENLIMPVSALNAMRREALEKLSEIRREKHSIPFGEGIKIFEKHVASLPEHHVLFRDARQMPERLPKEIKCVYLPLETDECILREKYAELKLKGIDLAVEAPRGLFGNEQRIREMIKIAANIGISRCMIHNIGLLDITAESGMKPIGGFGLNITNTAAIEEYHRLGLAETELSMELTVKRIENLGGTMPRGVTVYGRQALMLTRNCPASLGGKCGKNNAGCMITDRKNEVFPVMCRMGCSEVFNSIPLSIVEKTSQFSTVDWFLTRFSVENSVEIEEILKKSTDGNPLSEKRITRGLYYRGVE